MPPRWIHRVCLLAFLIGLALVVLGPIFVYQLSLATAESSDPHAAQQSLESWRSRFLWIMPAGVGLAFFGGIGALFIWVTKLANDMAPNSR